MRRALASAEVGDDVFGEDPTVRQLEARIAALLGKETAVFVPSGVMGNQIAIRAHTRAGDEVVVPERSHLYHYEAAAPAALWGVQLRPVGGLDGVLMPEDVETVVQGAYDWEATTALVCMENTVNKAGGVAVPLTSILPVAEAARAHELALHLDGARLWNAAVALSTSVAELARPFDTVNVCLSKGLGAPVGSALAGTAKHIRLARRARKLLGGGMRQAGVLAAAALVALDDFEANNHTMLRSDHARARQLADAVAALPAFELVAEPDTNIVMFNTLKATAADVLRQLEAEGVQMVPFGPTIVRATLHRDIDDAGLNYTIDTLNRLFAA